MKTLLCIQCTCGINDTGFIFIDAWANFIKKNRKNLSCDFAFIYNGFQYNRFFERYKDINIPIINIPHLPNVPAWDTDTSFNSIYNFYQQYDFIIRSDSDVFISIKDLATLLENLDKDMDFITATNFCRSINIHSANIVLDNRNTVDKSKYQWKPWGYPTHNSDFYIINTKFFKKALDTYNNNSLISKVSYPHTPFNTDSLKYSQICKLLGHNDTRNIDGVVHIDGSIRSDFWTSMCSLKPNMVGIVNYDKRSFRSKNHVLHYPSTVSSGKKWEDITDEINNAFPFEENISAPYLHLGHGYILDHFSENGPHNFIDQQGNIDQLKSYNKNLFTNMFCFTTLLMKNTDNNEIVGRFKNRMTDYFVSHQINIEKLKSLYIELFNFYKNQLKDYIQNSNDIFMEGF